MRLPLLLLLIQLLALRVRGTPAKHWRRAPAHGVFNVDLYAYNKPRMNLAGHQSRSGLSPPMGQLLEQLSQHSRRSAAQSAHYRNLDDAGELYPHEEEEEVDKEQHKTMESQAVNMQLTPVQMDSTLSKGHAHENVYSSEFHVQSIGAKKIVQLNTLSAGHERKPVRAQVMGQEQKQEQEELPLKMRLALPQLPAEEEEKEEKPTASSSITTDTSKDATAPAGAWESLTSVKETLAEPASETIIGTASTGMLQIVSQLTAENADDKHTKGHPGSELVHHSGTNETVAKRTRVKARRKPAKVGTGTRTGTKAPNEIDTKMTANPAVTPATATASAPAPIVAPPQPSTSLSVDKRQPPVKALETQSPEISTHRPVRTRGKGKGKGKGKRRPGSQRRPSSTVMQEEIETTTNWWQILPYAEIRTFLNTIYDTITDNDDDERATGAALYRRNGFQGG
ncbi:LOW QUALITY PROTEIN: nuclear receptor corepressor 2 [Drosophila subobscura]|uniref:LOW QUALITY PROTEIN: nuclear receptor corepressor 2 n=1 Tax=Drosophila subobscura TaxID=7241 RepID=UPI00155AD50A|nr:LOW QUALITY PROTEIN: nuclear receptor corepressor 2 [Drosophila subobscura]